MRVRLVLEGDVPGLERHFCSAVLRAGTEACPDFTMRGREVDDLSEVLAQVSPPRGYRAAAMRQGLYLEHGLLAPAHLEWHGERTCILAAPDLARVVWTYFVKAALTRYAIWRGWVHLKAGCLTVGDGGILISGEGKTSLMLAMRAASPGVRMVSNTHVLAAGDGMLYGIHTNVRVRPRQLRGMPCDPTGDTYYPPSALFGAGALLPAARACVLVHRRPTPGPLRVSYLPACRYQQAFAPSAYALRRYGLARDLLHDWAGGDRAAAERVQRIDAGLLDSLVERTPRFEITGDADHADATRTLAAFLAGVERSPRTVPLR